MDEKDSIYNSPESKLVDERVVEEKIIPYRGGYDEKMKAAMAILLLIGLSFTAISSLVNRSLDIAHLVLGSLFIVIHVFFIVYAIRRMRGAKVLGDSQFAKSDKLGIWGNIWRYYICKYSSVILLAVLLKFTGISEGLEPLSIELTIMFGILVLPTSLGVGWALFSRSRKDQFQWVVTVFRGY